jgi:hypothetical protein
VQDRITMQENKMGLSAAADEPALFPFGTLSISSIIFHCRALKLLPSLSKLFARGETQEQFRSISSGSPLPDSDAAGSTNTQNTAQTTAQTAAPQDKVTISPQAQQTLAQNAQPAAGGDVDHDGDSR